MEDAKDGKVNGWFSSHVSEDVARALIRINIKVQNEAGKVVTISRDFRPDLNVDYNSLEEQLSETPSMYAYWAMVMSEQKTVVGILERKIKRRRAVVVQTIINSSREAGVKVTSQEIKDLVEADDELERLEAELLVAQRTSGKLWNIVEAVKMKSEHLRSLSGFKKQEMRDAPR